MNFIDKILLEATHEEILDKHIKNPETGRSIKVSSALSYDDSHPVKKKALAMLAKADSSTKEIPVKKVAAVKPAEKRQSLKPHSVVVGVSKELKDMLDKKGYKNLNIYPQVTCTAKDIRFNPMLSKGKNKNSTWICKFPATQTNGKQIVKTAYTAEFMKAQQKIKYKKISKIKLEDLDKLYEKADKFMKNKDVRISDSACVIKILAKTGLRIGSTDTDHSDTGNLGVRTLQISNIKLKDGTVFFDYIGKSFQQNKAELKDPEVFAYLSKKIKGKQSTENLFTCSYRNCGQVMTKINSKINPKDLRTYKACEVASNYLNRKKLDLKLKGKDLIKQAKEVLKDAFKTVSDVLNNTPAMAKNSYVHPAVITGWLNSMNLVPKQVGYKHITLEALNTKKEMSFKDLEELTPLINSIRSKFKTSSSGAGDCGIVSLELFKRLPEKFKNFKLCAVWVKGVEEDHVLLTDGKYIIDPTGSQYGNKFYDFKAHHSDYKDWLKLDATMIKDIENETQATLKHRGIKLEEGIMTKQRLTELTSEDTLESEISEEDLYECEEYLLPKWVYEENWELVPKNS